MRKPSFSTPLNKSWIQRQKRKKKQGKNCGRGKSEWGKDSVRRTEEGETRSFSVQSKVWMAAWGTATWEGSTVPHSPWISGISLCSLYLWLLLTTFLPTTQILPVNQLNWKCFWPSSWIIQTPGWLTLSLTTLYQTRGISPNVNKILCMVATTPGPKTAWPQHFTLSLCVNLS